MLSEPKVIAPFQYPKGEAPMVTEVRGTILAGSVQTMRDMGAQDRYQELLDPQYHQAMRDFIVASWIPIEVAIAHYTAMDGLGLSSDEQIENGRKVADRVQNTYVGTILRGLRATGQVSPIGVLERFRMAMERLMRGGDSAVVQTGPKDVRVDCVAIPLANIAYFRYGWQGMFESSLGLVAKRVYVRHKTARRPDEVSFFISWV